jgi:hypothetical protein
MDLNKPGTVRAPLPPRILCRLLSDMGLPRVAETILSTANAGKPCDLVTLTAMTPTMLKEHIGKTAHSMSWGGAFLTPRTAAAG